MSSFNISYWPNASITNSTSRIDVLINNQNDLLNLFNNPTPEPIKTNQKIMTRFRQESRSASNTKKSKNGLITVDFDKSEIAPVEIRNKLIKNNINHICFTTWSHKNNDLNYFKILLPYRCCEDQIEQVTKGLTLLVNKKFSKTDDLSTNIFFGGVNPDHKDEFEIYSFAEGLSEKETLNFLLNLGLEDDKKSSETASLNDRISDLDEFELFDKTIGQKYTLDQIKDALNHITGEQLDNYSVHDIWRDVNLSCASTQNDEVYEILQQWNEKTYTPMGLYNHQENKNLWDRDSNRHQGTRLTLGTLFHLKKLYEQKNQNEIIKNSDYKRFSDFVLAPLCERNFLINDLIIENTIGCLAGLGGIGKSTLALEIAKSISSGNNFLGIENYTTKKGTVVIANKEDSEQKVQLQIHNDYAVQEQKKINIKSQFVKYEDFDDVIELTESEKDKLLENYKNIIRPNWSENNLILTDINGIKTENLNSLIDWFKDLQKDLKESNSPPLKLIIFDPLNLWHGGDQNSQKDMASIFSAFQQIQKELNTTILLIHHMNKSGSFTGSNTIRDTARFMFYFRPAKIHPSIDSQKYLEFYVDKHNDLKSDYKAFYVKRLDGSLFNFVDIKDIREEIEELENKQMINDAKKAIKKKKIKKRIEIEDDDE